MGDSTLLCALFGYCTFHDMYNLQYKWAERKLSFWRIRRWHKNGNMENGRKVDAYMLGYRNVIAVGYANPYDRQKNTAATERFSAGDADWEEPKALAKLAMEQMIASDELKKRIFQVEVYEVNFDTRQVINLETGEVHK